MVIIVSSNCVYYDEM